MPDVDGHDEPDKEVDTSAEEELRAQFTALLAKYMQMKPSQKEQPTRILVGYDFVSPDQQIKDILCMDDGDKEHKVYPLPGGEYRLYWDIDLVDWVIE